MNAKHLFEDIRKRVEDEGYYTSRGKAKEFPVSLVCASIKDGKRLCGSSFWIAEIKGKVYFCSWGYRYWRVTDLERLSELCLEYLSIPSCKIPTPEMIEEYNLQEIEYEEFTKIIS